MSSDPTATTIFCLRCNNNVVPCQSCAPVDRFVTYAEAIERMRRHKREAERHEQEAQRWALIAERKR